MSEISTLPHWDLTPLYPGLDSPEFETAFDQLFQSINDMTAFFDEHQIDRIEEAETNQETVAIFESLVMQFNQVLEQVYEFNAYLMGHLATDSRNTLAQAKYSEIQPKLAQLELMGTRMTAWIGSHDIEYLVDESDVAAEHAFMLQRARRQSLHLMSPIEEALAADLRLTGGSSWTRLFNNYSSQLTADVEIDGEVKTMPLTAVQNLSYHPDRDVRRKAYEAQLKTLKESAVPLAAALNAIKGETLTLAERRGWDNPLDMVLFDNAIDRQTLDAMMEATRAAFPDFRRYLRARAKALGLPVLAHYDRLVALGEGSQSWAYEDASQFVIDQFGTYSNKMKQMAERAFRENWIDAEPRDGKRGGAFCMNFVGETSRILTNYEPGFTGVGTLAHELGHAYHNLNLADRSPLLRQTPMTLAETASTFCQKIVENAALSKADAEDQLIILDGLLEYASRVVLGATSNFMFEERLFEKRAQRELSVEELCELDAATQQEATDDAVDPDLLHPYRWAYVPHYYGATFYNFPYTFGLLFGLGLYAQYQKSPESFKDGYDKLLSMTGMGEAAELAAEFGIDVRSPRFWEESMDLLRVDIERFVQLVEELA